jgi:hypothetical protein
MNTALTMGLITWAIRISVAITVLTYSVTGSHVNTLEGFWSRLKSSINGTHIHISGKHLDKYAAEFEYRFNSRLSPEKMLPELLGTFPSPLKK